MRADSSAAPLDEDPNRREARCSNGDADIICCGVSVFLYKRGFSLLTAEECLTL